LEQRLQPPAGRSSRQRHGIGSDERVAWLPPRARMARHGADRSAERRDTIVLAGRRRGDSPWLLRPRTRSPNRIRRVPRTRVAGRAPPPAVTRVAPSSDPREAPCARATQSPAPPPRATPPPPPPA